MPRHTLAGLSGGSQASARKKPPFSWSAGPSRAPPVGIGSSYRHKPVASLSSSRAIQVTNLSLQGSAFLGIFPQPQLHIQDQLLSRRGLYVLCELQQLEALAVNCPSFSRVPKWHFRAQEFTPP